MIYTFHDDTLVDLEKVCAVQPSLHWDDLEGMGADAWSAQCHSPRLDIWTEGGMVSVEWNLLTAHNQHDFGNPLSKCLKFQTWKAQVIHQVDDFKTQWGKQIR